MSTYNSFQLKGGLFTLTVLHLQSVDLKKLEDELKEKIAASPDFFKQIPVVIDLSLLTEDEAIDLGWLKNLLIANSLIPVALRNVPEYLMRKALSADWAIFPDAKNKLPKESSSGTDEAAIDEGEKVKEVQDQTEMIENTPYEIHLVTQQVRSGQQIFRPSGDVVIVNTVNTGAEVLADGNIHVYGALRGRALAGINGNTKARIFCQSLEAELVSIAGKYKVIEELSGEWKGKAVQIYLEDDELKIEQFIKQ